ncbi:hypothetical protein A9K55_003065 [Cordyceps militaris]|uniref:DNA mismatch repair protein HSM3 N-terminal domain-containing protein n=1 Tax=Cordyceps militaris TaxID=73501 RepID=A0A2H4S5Z2_CORMI|nr:hypothetical protein A9K55_003065 [Cordyceps militaris]
MSAGRIVPQVAMDALPISRLDELHTHLAALLACPETPLDAGLCDEVELQLTGARRLTPAVTPLPSLLTDQKETNIPPLLPTLLPPLTQILLRSSTSAPADPSPLLSLTTKLLRPLPLARVLALADAPTVLAALRSPLPGANRLALAVLEKAARSPADAALLSTLPELVAALVARWLDVEDVGVGERAGRVLGDVLATDCCHHVVRDAPPPAINGIEVVYRRQEPGHGRLWDLVLNSESIFALIPQLCSPSSTQNNDGNDAVPRRTERQVSLAQGRLLRLLPRLATLNLRAVTESAFPQLLPLPQSVARHTGCGLLQWAALAMVDKADVLMHLSLVDFFETLVSVMRTAAVEDAPSPSTSVTGALVRAATANDSLLKEALLGLPDRTVEEEAEPLRIYIGQLLNGA